MDDRELDSCIKSFKRTGDNLYYEKIFRYFFSRILRFVLLNISDRHLAEDITVDVFYRVYRHMPQLNLDSARFKAWVYKIARNLIIDYHRKAGRQQENLSFQQYMEENQPDYLDKGGIIEDKPIENSPIPNSIDGSITPEFNDQNLLNSLDKLPEIQKQVIILRFVEELDYRTIGTIVGKSEMTVRAIKFRAIMRLKELLIK